MVAEEESEKGKIKKLITDTLGRFEQFSSVNRVEVHDSAETNYRIEMKTNSLDHFEKILEALKQKRYKVFSIALNSLIDDPDYTILIKIWV